MKQIDLKKLMIFKSRILYILYFEKHFFNKTELQVLSNKHNIDVK